MIENTTVELTTTSADEPLRHEEPAAPGPDPRAPGEERVPPSEPADAWALERARRELERLRERVAQLETASSATREAEHALRATLAEAREALDASERRRQIDQELYEARASDVETARLLTEMAVARMPRGDVASAVRELRKRKPHLFKRAGLRLAGASAIEPAREEGERLSEFAEDARTSGDRASLLRYLRARRGDE